MATSSHGSSLLELEPGLGGSIVLIAGLPSAAKAPLLGRPGFGFFRGTCDVPANCAGGVSLFLSMAPKI